MMISSVGNLVPGAGGSDDEDDEWWGWDGSGMSGRTGTMRLWHNGGAASSTDMH
jgi:hypothetical protein